jgi:hypothetical protein
MAIRSRSIVSVVVVASGLMAGALAQGSTVEYDAFCGLPVERKLRVFNEISPENRAALVRTQIQRWLDKNRSRLTAEQVKVMEDNIAFVRADLYKLPRRPEDLEKAKELEQRTLSLMAKDDMAQALTIHGPCIDKS